MPALLFAIWQYRHFISNSIRNELISRFARSKMGGLWMVLNPLSQVAIYTLILSNVLAARLPETTGKYAYAAYLIAGLLGWSLFSEIINRCLVLFVAQGNVIKKVSFPKITLPCVVVGSCLLNNLLLIAASLGILLLIGYQFTSYTLLLIPLVVATGAFATGVGLLLGVINVFVRDVGHVVPIALQIWFWFTPIVYPESIIPDQFKEVLWTNPLYPLIDAYHHALVYGTMPNLPGLWTFAGVTFSVLVVAMLTFRRASEEMVDAL